jgi:hypothetical protein
MAAAVRGLSPVIITGADAHGAEAVEALLDAALHDVLEVDDAEQAVAVGDGERRAARIRDAMHDGIEPGRQVAAERLDVRDDGVDGALAHLPAVEVATAHARVGAERNEVGAELAHVAAAQVVLLLHQHDDRAPLGRLVGEARELAPHRPALRR